MLATPAYRAVWRMARTGMNGDHRAYLNGLMKQAPPTEPRDVSHVWRTYYAEERSLQPAV